MPPTGVRSLFPSILALLFLRPLLRTNRSCRASTPQRGESSNRLPLARGRVSLSYYHLPGFPDTFVLRGPPSYPVVPHPPASSPAAASVCPSVVFPDFRVCLCLEAHHTVLSFLTLQRTTDRLPKARYSPCRCCSCPIRIMLASSWGHRSSPIID